MEKIINIKLGNFHEDMMEENGILKFINLSSINAEFWIKDSYIVTMIEGIMYKVVYLGFEDYLKYDIKGHLNDDVCFNDFMKVKEQSGKNWRTSADLISLVEGFKYQFNDDSKVGVRFGFNNIKSGRECLFGLIPVNMDLKIRVEYNLSYNEDEYEQTVIKEAV